MAALARGASSTPVTPERIETAVKPCDKLMADYLVAEVIQPMTAVEKQVLVSTCVYPEIDAALVEAATERSDSAYVLQELSRRHAFVQPTGSSPTSFRVHTLLRQALYAEACHQDPESMTQAHRRAGRWYAEGGRPAKAVEHLLLAGASAEADEFVIEQALAPLLTEPEGDDLARRIIRMPAGVEDPARSALHALVRAAAKVRLGDAVGARDELAEARALPSSQPPLVCARAVVAMSIQHALGDPGGTIAAAQEAERAWSRTAESAESAHVVEASTAIRALVLRTRGEAETRDGRLDAAVSSLTAALRTGGDTISLRERTRCLSLRAFVQATAGHFSAAAADVRRVDKLYEDGKLPDQDRPIAHDLARAWLAVEGLDPVGAERVLEDVQRRGESSADPVLSGGLALLRARLAPPSYGVPLGAGSRSPRRALSYTGQEGPADASRVGEQTLSAKELEVLNHLAELLTTEEIAAAMYISVNTVKTHIRSILRKLAVSRRNLAVRRAQQLGIV
jgi:LuxR family maltose regulon positive regulatory protein